jgi:hypothetical protein
MDFAAQVSLAAAAAPYRAHARGRATQCRTREGGSRLEGSLLQPADVAGRQGSQRIYTHKHTLSDLSKRSVESILKENPVLVSAGCDTGRLQLAAACTTAMWSTLRVKLATEACVSTLRASPVQRLRRVVKHGRGRTDDVSSGADVEIAKGVLMG